MRKQILFSLVTIATNITLQTGHLSDAHAYEKHEKPFANIGSSFSQRKGNSQCKAILGNRKNTKIVPIPVQTPRGIYRIPTLQSDTVKSYDGTVINNPSHIWYHKNNGECIANI